MLQYDIALPEYQDDKLDDFEKEEASTKRILKSIFQVLLTMYNHILEEKGKPLIKDLNFPTLEHYSRECETYYEKFKSIQESKDAPINAFTSMVDSICEFVFNRDHNLISKTPKDIRIKKYNTGEIVVENLINNLVVCRITFGSDKTASNIFSIEILTKKGKMGAPAMVEMYSIGLIGDISSGLRRPDERELSAIMGLEKKSCLCHRPFK